MENKPKIIERERVYIYRNEFGPGVVTSTFMNVVKVEVKSNGTHEVTTSDGVSHYVHNDFINIQAIPAKEEEK